MPKLAAVGHFHEFCIITCICGRRVYRAVASNPEIFAGFTTL